MLTLTLNLIITSKRSLMNCRNKIKKKHDRKFAVVSHSTALKHDITMSSVMAPLAFSNTNLEECLIGQALVSWKLYPAYTTILKSYHDIFMHSHVYVVVNFYLGQFLFFFCLWVW